MPRRKKQPQFVLCLRSDGCDDLIPRKIYQVLPDESAATENLLRIVDESGEDYLYPADHFAPVELSEDAAKALLQTA